MDSLGAMETSASPKMEKQMNSFDVVKTSARPEIEKLDMLGVVKNGPSPN